MPTLEYREIGNHRGFMIAAATKEKPTAWYVDVRIGTHDGAGFSQKLGSINREFSKPAGTLNCLLTMEAEAENAIDRYLSKPQGACHAIQT